MNEFIFNKKLRDYFKEPKGQQQLAKDLFGYNYFRANNFQNWAMINNHLRLTDAHSFVLKN